MDQDKNNQHNDDTIDVDDDQNTMEYQPETMDTSTDQQNEAPVIIKKSSNKLALFLSVLALFVPCYLLYVEYTSKQEGPDTEFFDNQIQQFGEENKKLSDRLQVLSTRLDDELIDIKNQLEQFKSQPNNTQTSVPFDNTQNEEALNNLEKQLSQQLNNHKSELDALKQNLAASQLSSATAKEVIPGAADMYDTQRAIDALYAADLLLRTQRLPQAISTLQQLLASAHLRPRSQQQFQLLINQWQQVQQPDAKKLMEELLSLKQQIKEIALPTIKLNEEETSWYNRFISVKKIESDGILEDSHSLHLLQAQLTQHVLQAEWALTLQQGTAWQQQLNSAKHLVQQQLPKETTLANDLQHLANQQIVALLPTPSGIHDLISELKGLR